MKIVGYVDTILKQKIKKLETIQKQLKKFVKVNSNSKELKYVVSAVRKEIRTNAPILTGIYSVSRFHHRGYFKGVYKAEKFLNEYFKNQKFLDEFWHHWDWYHNCGNALLKDERARGNQNDR